MILDTLFCKIIGQDSYEIISVVDIIMCRLFHIHILDTIRKEVKMWIINMEKQVNRYNQVRVLLNISNSPKRKIKHHISIIRVKYRLIIRLPHMRVKYNFILIELDHNQVRYEQSHISYGEINMIIFSHFFQSTNNIVFSFLAHQYKPQGLNHTTWCVINTVLLNDRPLMIKRRNTERGLDPPNGIRISFFTLFHRVSYGVYLISHIIFTNI